MTSAELLSVARPIALSNTQAHRGRQPRAVHPRQAARSRRGGPCELVRSRGERTTMSWIRPASGLVTALDPVMRAWGGTWVAHGSGSADREAADAQRPRAGAARPAVLHAAPRLAHAGRRGRLLLRPLQRRALAALPHRLRAPGVRRERLGGRTAASTARFADAVLEEIGDAPAIVFVQDYHFALLPRLLKDARPDVIVCQFWHIPVAEPRGVPHLPVGRGNPARPARQRPAVVPHPVPLQQFPRDGGADARSARRLRALRRGPRRTRDATSSRSRSASIRSCGAGRRRRRVATPSQRDAPARSGWATSGIIFGVDRLDYTKGIPDRHPRVRAHARATIPSGASASCCCRSARPAAITCRATRRSARKWTRRSSAINATHGTDGWQPVVYLREHRGAEDIAAMYRAADVCVVSSLHDGMNLVAKEFIASRTDHRGVLVLSRFTGAARELHEAVLVNPFAVDEFADALHDALSMPEADQQTRADAQRCTRGSRRQTVYDWAAGILRRRRSAHGGSSPHDGCCSSRRDRQRAAARAGQPGHQHRLALHAAVRQRRRCSRGCSTRRTAARSPSRPTGMRDARWPTLRNTNVLRTEVDTARWPLRGLRLRAAHADRAVRRGAARDSSPDPPARGHAADPRRASTRARLRARHARVRRPIGAGLEIRGGPIAPVPAIEHSAADYIESGFPFRVDRPLYFVLSCGRPTEVDSTRLGRSRARAHGRRLARSGRSHARCRRSRRRPCCARRCA